MADFGFGDFDHPDIDNTEGIVGTADEENSFIDPLVPEAQQNGEGIVLASPQHGESSSLQQELLQTAANDYYRHLAD